MVILHGTIHGIITIGVGILLGTPPIIMIIFGGRPGVSRGDGAHHGDGVGTVLGDPVGAGDPVGEHHRHLLIILHTAGEEITETVQEEVVPETYDQTVLQPFHQVIAEM